MLVICVGVRPRHGLRGVEFPGAFVPTQRKISQTASKRDISFIESPSRRACLGCVRKEEEEEKSKTGKEERGVEA